MARYARDIMESSFLGAIAHDRPDARGRAHAARPGPLQHRPAARQLGMSRRTGNRALAREGHTFSQIVDDAPRSASRYVA
jgi:hypothetical protein